MERRCARRRFTKTCPVGVPETRLGSTELGNSGIHSTRRAVPSNYVVPLRARTVVRVYTRAERSAPPAVVHAHDSLRPSTFPGERKNSKKGQCSIYDATFNLTLDLSLLSAAAAFLNHLAFVRPPRAYMYITSCVNATFELS